MEGVRIEAQATKGSSPVDRVLPPAPPATLPRAGLRPLSGLTLFSVGALVVSVSLVLLRDFASQENERDALQTVRLFGAALAAERGDAPLAEVDTLGEIAQRRPQLLARLEDHRWLAGGRLLLRHGYLFEAARAGSAIEVRAWPWAFGRTGFASFAWKVPGELWGHPGHDGWSGEGSPPRLGERPAAPWRRLGRD